MKIRAMVPRVAWAIRRLLTLVFYGLMPGGWDVVMDMMHTRLWHHN